MLVSVAIGVALSYPTLFLSANPTAGFTSIPHHVWTTAKSIGGVDDGGAHADVEMRQVWVHGSYNQALEKDVLKSALKIQQTLVGDEQLTNIIPALGEKLESSELSWGYHSPLMYWNNSAEAIDQDDDVVRTINEQARSSSSLNVALRPASVLAGKTFHHRKLVSADALVLTLMNKIDDDVGSKWQDKMHSLEDSACEKCSLYPPHGQISSSRVYEFSFMPLSMRENAALGFAYSFMALYVLLSLRRLKAFHSRVGLVVTAITQITTSIMASFTICGMLKINLATVPQNAYPFIVLVIGLENMFRLINAILAYPPTMATDLRIANALGDIGPLSVATAGQNLLILWLLSLVVSPGIITFCIFAGVATLFDTFFLLTFFVAVLNVDIRRLELQDSIARSNQVQKKARPPKVRRSWIDALMHGRLPFSTRMAGSTVTTTFILSLNYHFFEHQGNTMNFRHLLGLVRGGPPGLADFDTFGPPPMNVTLTPGEWLRMQDFDTAREVMRLVRPGAHSFVIRVFAPLVVVLSGADRTGVPEGTAAWFNDLRGFALHHFYPFAVVVIFVVTFVAVLMNFLLYNEAPETSSELPERNEQALMVQHVQLMHKLDIVMMAGSKLGHFMTIGFDRTVSVAVLDRSQGDYYVDNIPSGLTSMLIWPLRNVAIDDHGEWLAFHCANDDLMICNRKLRSFVNGGRLRYPDDHPSVLFEYVHLPTSTGMQLHFITLTSGGRLVTACTEDGRTSSTALSDVSLVGAAVVPGSSSTKRLVTVSDSAQINAHEFNGEEWTVAVSQPLLVKSKLGRIEGLVTINPFPDIDSGLLIVSTPQELLIINSQTLAPSSPARRQLSHPSVAVSGQKMRCPSCEAVAMRSIGLVNETRSPRELCLQVLSTQSDEHSSICMRNTGPECASLEKCSSTSHRLQAPGAWRALPSQAVLGVRERPIEMLVNNQDKTASALRRRRHSTRSFRTMRDSAESGWEAYALFLNGDSVMVEVSNDASNGLSANAVADPTEQTCSLYVTKAGPSVSLDGQSVGIAFGNAVKVLRAPKAGNGFDRGDPPGLERHGSTSRKRQGARK